MEWRCRVPSQPSNFVSILHLRERWLKENERNQKEKEEQEQLDRQVQQQEIQRTEPEEKKDQKKPEDVKLAVKKPRNSRYRRAVPASNSGNVKETCKKTEDEGEPPVADPPIGSDEKKKKSKKKGRKKNPKAQKEEMDRTLRTPEENLKEEIAETKCEVVVQNGKKNVRARMKCEEKKEMGLGSQCGPEIGYTHEMENKLSRISVSFEIKRGRNNGVYRDRSQGNRTFRDDRNVYRSAPHKPRDVGMIWVRKDELSKGA